MERRPVEESALGPPIGSSLSSPLTWSMASRICSASRRRAGYFQSQRFSGSLARAISGAGRGGGWGGGGRGRGWGGGVFPEPAIFGVLGAGDLGGGAGGGLAVGGAEHDLAVDRLEAPVVFDE